MAGKLFKLGKKLLGSIDDKQNTKDDDLSSKLGDPSSIVDDQSMDLDNTEDDVNYRVVNSDPIYKSSTANKLDAEGDNDDLKRDVKLQKVKADAAIALDNKTNKSSSNMTRILSQYGAHIDNKVVPTSKVIVPEKRVMTPDRIDLDPSKVEGMKDLITANVIALSTKTVLNHLGGNTQLILDKLDNTTQRSLESHKAWQDEQLTHDEILAKRQAELTASQVEVQKAQLSSDAELQKKLLDTQKKAQLDDAASDASANQISDDNNDTTKSDGPKILRRLKERLNQKTSSDDKLKWGGLLLPIIIFAVDKLIKNWDSIKTSVTEWVETGPLSGVVEKVQEWRKDWKYLSDKNYTVWQKVANLMGGGRVADKERRFDGHVKGETIRESATKRSTIDDINAGKAATYISDDTMITTKDIATANSKVSVAAMARDDRKVTDEELQTLYGAPLVPHKLVDQSDKSTLLGQFEGFVNKEGISKEELDYYNILNFTGGALHYYLQGKAKRPTYLNDDTAAMALMMSGYSRIKNLTDFADEAGLSPERFNLAYSSILDSYHRSLATLYQVSYDTIKSYVEGLDTTELSNFLKLKRGELGLDSTYSLKLHKLMPYVYRDGYEWTNSKSDKQEPNVRPFSMTDNTFSIESQAMTDNANYELLRSLIKTTNENGDTRVISKGTTNDKLLSIAGRSTEGPYQSSTYQSDIEKGGAGTFLSSEAATDSGSYENRSINYIEGSENAFRDITKKSLAAIDSFEYPITDNPHPGIFSSIPDKDRKDAFINTMMPLVRNKLQSNNIDPNYDHIVVSQMALESGWGQSESGKFNFSGLKAKKDKDGNPTEPATRVLTHEYYDADGDGKNEKHQVYDWFKDFSSLDDYFDYYIPRLRDRFDAFKGSATTGSFASNIRSRGYFTAPLDEYADSLASISNTIKRNYSGPNMDLGLPALSDTILQNPNLSRSISVAASPAIKAPEIENSNDGQQPSTGSESNPTQSSVPPQLTSINAPSYKGGTNIVNHNTTVNIHQDNSAMAEIS